jgi:hypothetical protein
LNYISRFFGAKICDRESGITGAQSEYQPLLHLGGQWGVVVQHKLCTALSCAALWVNVETTSAVQYAAFDQHFIFGLKYVPASSGIKRRAMRHNKNSEENTEADAYSSSPLKALAGPSGWSMRKTPGEALPALGCT